MPQGQPPGGWLPEQRLTLEQAFAAFTRGAAYAGFAEDRLGTLEPGRMADFIFVDRDIFADSRASSADRARRRCWKPMSAARKCGSGVDRKSMVR